MEKRIIGGQRERERERERERWGAGRSRFMLLFLSGAVFFLCITTC